MECGEGYQSHTGHLGLSILSPTASASASIHPNPFHGRNNSIIMRRRPWCKGATSVVMAMVSYEEHEGVPSGLFRHRTLPSHCCLATPAPQHVQDHHGCIVVPRW